MTDHNGYVLAPLPVAPVNETDMVMLPEGLKALKKVAKEVGLDLGCRTFLSCISKGFGGFCSRLLRLRTGKLSSAFRLHGFADIFGHPGGDILASNRGQRLSNEVVGELTTHAGNQEDGLVQFATAVGL